MPLDSAQFISELSIDDPPGTDPLNQGDDQIRTTKRATQQSFPNVDAAVPQSAAQMAQMAIKNEANTFTQINTFAVSGNRFTDLSVCAAQGTDPAGHHYEDEFGERRWSVDMASVAGSRSFEIRRRDTSGNLLDTPISIDVSNGLVFLGDVGVRIPDGSAGAPGVAFALDNTMGVFRTGAGQMSFAVNGEEKFRIADQVISMRGSTTQLRIQDGSAAVPTIAFVAGDTDTGMYRFASNVLGFSTAGVARATITNAGIRSNIAGSAGAPSYSFNDDADTGMFVILANQLGFAAGGTERMRIKINTVNVTLPSSAAGLVSGDIWRNGNFVGIIP